MGIWFGCIICILEYAPASILNIDRGGLYLDKPNSTPIVHIVPAGIVQSHLEYLVVDE